MLAWKGAGFFLTIALAALLLAALPYLWAADAGDGAVFGGFLFNPLDGNSYLAKMYQGWQGSWQFRLPYTAEPGEGAYLFLFYLFLGHLARWSGLPLLWVFHLARLAGALAMLLALARLFEATLPEAAARRLAFALAAFGSGLGWLAALFGGFTADFWLAEAYPFLSAFANPHFPLGLALTAWLVTPARVAPETIGPARGGGASPNSDPEGLHHPWGETTPVRLAVGLAAGLALGVILPFGVVVAGAALLGAALWEVFGAVGANAGREAGRRAANAGRGGLAKFTDSIARVLRSPGLRPQAAGLRLAGVAAGGGAVLAYDLWTVTSQPQLAAWNAQNLTPAPPLWDLLISFSPALWLALPGAWLLWREEQRQARPLLLWALVGWILLLLPFGLQRRFALGLYVPLAGLAAFGARRLPARRGRAAQALVAGALLLALPGNLVVLAAAAHGVRVRDSRLYLSAEEKQAFEWLAANAPDQAIVLAAPETSAFIPAHTGLRVIYGHPFETVEALDREAAVRRFFAGQEPDLLQQADYVLVGRREQALGGAPDLSAIEPVFRQGEVSVYGVGPAAAGIDILDE